MPPVCPRSIRTVEEGIKGSANPDCNETTPDPEAEVNTPKDPLPDVERSNVVYRIPCAECPATYVGETKRKLCKRIDEHKRALRMCDFNASAVAEHAWNAGHHVDWSGVTILDLDQTGTAIACA